nr:uncharacterized protein LOC120366792 [Saimiri boliviensis boliviensis]
MERGVRLSVGCRPGSVSVLAPVCHGVVVSATCRPFLFLPSCSCATGDSLFPPAILVAGPEAAAQARVAPVVFAFCFLLSCVLMFGGVNLIKMVVVFLKNKPAPRGITAVSLTFVFQIKHLCPSDHLAMCNYSSPSLIFSQVELCLSPGTRPREKSQGHRSTLWSSGPSPGASAQRWVRGFYSRVPGARLYVQAHDWLSRQDAGTGKKSKLQSGGWPVSWCSWAAISLLRPGLQPAQHTKPAAFGTRPPPASAGHRGMGRDRDVGSSLLCPGEGLGLDPQASLWWPQESFLTVPVVSGPAVSDGSGMPLRLCLELLWLSPGLGQQQMLLD